MLAIYPGDFNVLPGARSINLAKHFWTPEDPKIFYFDFILDLAGTPRTTEQH